MTSSKITSSKNITPKTKLGSNTHKISSENPSSSEFLIEVLPDIVTQEVSSEAECSSQFEIIFYSQAINTTNSTQENLPSHEDTIKDTSPKSSSTQQSSEPSSAQSPSKPSSDEPSSTPSSSPSSETESNTSSDTSSETSSESHDSPEDKENSKKADDISKSYGLPISIAYDERQFDCEYIESYSSNPQEIKYGLNQVETALASFPSNYFEKTSTKADIVLVSKTTTNTVVLNDSTIIVPCFKNATSIEINNFLLSISAKKLSEHIQPDYNKINPYGFFYGDKKEKYIYKPSQARFSYFISSKAQESYEDDLYENFIAIFKNENMLKKVPNYSPLYEKMQCTCRCLYEWSDCFAEIEIVKKFL